MSGSLTTFIVLAVVAGYLVTIYNRLVSLRNRHSNAFSQIDVQLQRCYELIPNLVELAKEYMRHESETLTAVVEARNTASSRLQDASASPDNPSADLFQLENEQAREAVKISFDKAV